MVKFKIQIKKYVLQTMCTGSQTFVDISMYPSLVTHLPENGHKLL